MPRQPFSTKFPGVRVAIGPQYLKSRPHAASIIAQCVCGWTEVELQTALLLARMLKANSKPVVAMYFTLANERAKREAMMAIAEFVFNEDDKRLFNATMLLKKSIEKQRNDLAHGLFGITDKDPEGIAWISTKDRIQHLIWTDSLINPPGSLVRDGQQIAATKAASFYTIADLESLLEEIASLHTIISLFSYYINQKTPESLKVSLRQQLLNEPLVQRFLSPPSTHSENDP